MLIKGMEAALEACASEEVIISGWKPGQEWAVRLRRPSVVEMAVDGNIGNPLIGVVDDMIVGGGTAVRREEEDPAGSKKAMRQIVRAALVEPSYDDFLKGGGHLTDMQYLEIYAWVLGGLAGLDTFRRTARRGAGGDDAAVAPAAEPGAQAAG